jgi:uncharacterized repeat protein (TIGR04052 family)
MNFVQKTFMPAFLASVVVTPCCAQVLASPAVPLPQKLHIAFAAQVAGKPFACDKIYDEIGLAKTSVKGSDLRFFVSAVELITSDGKAIPMQLDQDGIWQYKNLALLDFEDGTGSCSNGNVGMHKEVSGTIPSGDYVGLRFTLGVPFELDHIDASSAPSPLNTTAMFWSWQNGYKFLRAEVAPVTPSATSVPTDTGRTLSAGMQSRHRSNGFAMHLGSTGCADASVTATPSVECAHPNRPVITFQTFNPDKDTVVFDLAKLLQGVDLTTSAPNEGPGCMSLPGRHACITPMRALGIPFGDAPATEQIVFSREVHE